MDAYTEKVNLLVCGMHWSGSSALTDLLREYQSVYSVPYEFDELRRPLLLNDIFFSERDDGFKSLRKYATYTMIKRQIHSIISTKGKSFSLASLRADLARSSKILSMSRMELKSKNPLGGIEAIADYINYLGVQIATGKRFVLFDQPLLLNSYYDKWPTYFGNFRCFVVLRDPRDQFFDLLKNNHLFLDFDSCITGGLQEIYGEGRIGAIRYNVEAIKARYRAVKKLKEHPNIHVIKFEDLVERYENTVRFIETVTGMTENEHVLKKQYFNPRISKKNIGIGRCDLPADCIPLIDELYDEYNAIECT